MKKSILLFVFLLSLVQVSFSQKTCGTDLIIKQSLEENPEKVLIRNQLEDLTKEFITQYGNSARMGQEYIIPVVVHVIHNYGDENITDEQIARAMETINEDWNAENDDITETIEEFSDIVADFGVEFRLATKDPDGNCTHGITRTASPFTEGNDEAARSLLIWPTQNYVNIFVIKSMSPGSTAAAYAFYPGVGWPNDCIVSTHTYFGHGVGTAGGSNYVRHTMSHEMGHFMNLSHPWGNGEIGVQDNCDTDDDVEDTPNTIGANQNCNLSQESCGSLDNVQNIMDYASCAHMFTEGQKQRVHAAISMSPYRENLWQQENLELTGVDDDHLNADNLYEDCAPIPDFNTASNVGCQSNPVQFFEHAYNSDIETMDFEWNFGEGANPQTSTQKNPLVTYTEKGLHSVSLKVCNGPIDEETSICSEITRENYMYILDALDVSSASGMSQHFAPNENGTFPENDGWYVVEQQPDDDGNIEETWSTTTSASWNDETSIRIRSRYFGDELNSHTFTTPELNLGELSSAQMYFHLAYALKSNQVDDEGDLLVQDELVIYTSDDCGETWMARKTYDTEDLITVFDQYGNPKPIFNTFIPEGDSTNPGDWLQKTFSLNNVAGDQGVILKFEFTGTGLNTFGENVGGNWLYIDNIRVGQNFVDIDNEKHTSLNIFPNPSSGSADIEIVLHSATQASIELYNILGKSIVSKSFDLQKGLNIIKLEEIHNNLSTGNYLINVIMNQEKLSNHIIITK